MRPLRGSIVALCIALLGTAPARASSVQVSFRVTAELHRAPIAHCLVSVPAHSKAFAVFAAAKKKHCIFDDRLARNRTGTYVWAIDGVIGAGFYCTGGAFWFGYENGRYEEYLEAFSADAGDTLEYEYYGPVGTGYC